MVRVLIEIITLEVAAQTEKNKKTEDGRPASAEPHTDRKYAPDVLPNRTELISELPEASHPKKTAFNAEEIKPKAHFDVRC